MIRHSDTLKAKPEDIDQRIKLSASRLREWQWLVELSTAPDDVVAQLRLEAREIIALGPKFPQKAKTIGKLVVGYNRLITSITEKPKDIDDVT